MSSVLDEERTPSFLAGGSRIGALIQTLDWAATPLGPIEAWPQSLKTAVDIMLTSPAPISVMWGPDHVQLYNDAYMPIAAERHPAALGRPAAVNWPEAYDDFLGPIIERAFAGEAVALDQHAVRLRRADGSFVDRFFTGTFSPVRDDTGGIGGVLHPLTEVTAKVRADEELRESEARLRGVLDGMGESFALLDHEFRIVDMNAEALRMEVRPLAEIIGKTHWEAHPDADPELGELYRRAMADRKPRLHEHRYEWPDGRATWLSVRVYPVADGLAVFYGDITDRKEAEAELHALNDTLERRVEEAVAERTREQERVIAAEAAHREADALYRAYFENTPEALFVIGVEPHGGFVVEEINPAHEAGVGLKLDDIRGRRIDDILPEAAAEKVLGTYRHVVETGATYHYREQFDLTGDPQHWDTSLVPMRDGAGRVVRLIGSSRNVTRQVLAEEALRQAQKMEAMGQLTGGVAHDFNNLLTPIVGALDMLQRKGLGGEREQRLIGGAAQSADRARTLVQRLLAFARRQPLQPVAVDVAKLVTGMADLIASTTGPQIRIMIEVAPDLPPAKADPNQLEMAVLNLAVNARDAMPDGGELRIGAKRESVPAPGRPGLKRGHYVRLSVSDSGVGMDQVTRERAVEPFFSTKGIGKGTGLGLSMVHGLTAQLGGALTIESAPGRGTTVEIWLPISATLADGDDERVATAPVRVARGTALLVDDEELVRISTADMLIDLGFEVLEAACAEEALRLLIEGAAPDLLITDHLMPGMTGAELAKEARRLRPALPVLVVSGYAEVEGIAPNLPRLTKPFRNAELAASLSALMPAA